MHIIDLGRSKGFARYRTPMCLMPSPPPPKPNQKKKKTQECSGGFTGLRKREGEGLQSTSNWLHWQWQKPCGKGRQGGCLPDRKALALFLFNCRVCPLRIVKDKNLLEI